MWIVGREMDQAGKRGVCMLTIEYFLSFEGEENEGKL